MSVQHRSAIVAGVNVAYRDGNPASPALLLLHGFPTHAIGRGLTSRPARSASVARATSPRHPVGAGGGSELITYGSAQSSAHPGQRRGIHEMFQTMAHGWNASIS